MTTTDPEPEINWAYNCLTGGIHHGRPEAIWNVPLLHAANYFPPEALQDLVIARIYNDAMQMVGHSDKFDQAWAKRVKAFAEEEYALLLMRKVKELSDYYLSPDFRQDIQDAAKWFESGKLNQHYAPLHSHDTINMLCRILGVGAETKARA